MIKIDKHVPIPKDNRGRQSKYPWDQMDVGDSFLVGPDGPRGMRGIASGAGTKRGKKFATRALEDGSVRVWRVA